MKAIKRIKHPPLTKILGDYGLGLCLVSFALLLTLLLEPWMAPHTSSLFLAAIALTAWQKGLYPSLPATLASVLATDYFFNAPVNSFELSPENAISAFVFSMVALLISWVHEDRKRALEARSQWLAREMQAKAEARRANRAKDMFLAMVSHELRSPLNVILSWTLMMQKEGFDSAATSHALSVIERNARVQKQLIDDLLDVSQITAGKFHIETSPVDIVTVIENAISTVNPALETKAIELIRDYDRGQVSVSGDADRLQQVFWNLLSNAAKFTPEKGRIKIGLETTDTHARIIVTDTGAGISQELLPHVFEHFFQGDAGIKPKLRGLGLGLPIARHLVEAHGGTLHASSPGEGLGSTFTVELPLLHAQPRDGQQPLKKSVSINPERELGLSQ